MIAGKFLNSVVINSLMKSSQLRKKLGFFRILVLSWFDLAVVTFTHPMLFLLIISWSVKTHQQGENRLGNWAYTVGYNLSGFSTSALLTMSVERYLALKYPFFHHIAVTKRRLLFFQAFLVVIKVSVSFTTFLLENIWQCFHICIHFIIPVPVHILKLPHVYHHQVKIQSRKKCKNAA